MKQFLFYIALLCLVSSCSVKERSILDEFDTVVNLSDEECVLTDCVAPNNLVMADSLLFYEEPQDKDLMRCYHLKEGRIKKFLSRGNGPDEALNVIRTSYTSADSLLQVYVEPEMILLYDIKDMENVKIQPVESRKLTEGQYAYSSAYVVGGDEIFYTGKASANDTCRYCMYHWETDSIYSFGAFPKEDIHWHNLPMNDCSRQLAYQGHAVLSPDGSKLFFYFFYALGFEIIDAERNRITHSSFKQYPDVKLFPIPELGINRIKHNPDSFRGFLDACTTDEHIYVLYSGKRFSEDYSAGKYVLKYTWNGTPETLYQLDVEATSIATDKEGTKLYCSTNEENARIICYHCISPLERGG